MNQDENDLLTQTGPGTPCGEMLRRYWQPAALAEELPSGGAPLPVKLLGEELVLFRDDQGRPGLLELHCSHRGANLSYGRLEDGGLRCIYHGWLYDIHGNIMDMPGEVDGGASFRDSICHKAYPCLERGGAIFAYMGPGEPPLFPNYEFLTVPEKQRFVTKYFQSCNYLQANEGNIDPIHASFLHHPNYNLRHTGIPEYQGFRGGRGVAPGIESIDAEVTDFGVRLCRACPVGSDKKDLRIWNFVLPNLTTFPGGLQSRAGYSVNWHVPIDDTQHWKYSFIFNREAPLDSDVIKRVVPEMTPDYRLTRSRENRYMQERRLMATESYTGIGSFAAQDTCVVEGEGPIQDRTQEHLASSDRVIVAERKLLLKAIRDVQEGRDPQHVTRDAKLNRFPHMIVWYGVVPSATEWREHCKRLEAEAVR
ncbi:MAG TPA: Rieske 2Fe-2S domain-containing protein [Candidatus Binatia bacterium]|jgi:phenylpropionate dioxygenase-like ring-hydroxylating dioxygenase large terminal subunit